MNYYVHINFIHRYLKIHFGACGCCKYGEGMHPGLGENVEWRAFESLDEAIQFSRTYTHDNGWSVSGCGACAKGLNV